MPSTNTPRVGRRTLLTGASAALLAGAASGCSLQVRSRPDPTIGADTLQIAGDKGNPTFTANFNPFQANARTSVGLIYEPLILLNPLDGSMDPWLAADWDQSDPSSVTMTLREGATWSDGTPLTADDVLFTFGMLKEFPANDLKGVWGHLDSLEADGQRIRFTLKGADSPAVGILGATLIVPEHIWSDVEDPTTWRNEKPVGSGPFTLASFTPLQYSMDRFADHWAADDVDVEHIVFPAATGELDVVTKGYDWCYSFMSDVDATWGAANAHNRHWFPPGGIIGLHPNHDKAPFDDLDVRRGLALAIDGDAVGQAAAEGYMDEAGQTGLLLPNQEDLLDPSIPDKGIIAQDAKAAIASFEKAGFTHDGSVMRTKDGDPFTLAITTANGYTDWLRAVQEVQRQLGKIGIEVTISAPQAAAYEAALSDGDFTLAVGSSNGSDAYQGYANLLSSEYYQPVGKTSQNNRIRFRDDEVDDLLRRYRESVDEDEQTEIIHGLEQAFYEKIPIVSLYYGGLWGLYNDGRFTGWPDAEDPYTAPQTYGSSPLKVLTRLRRAGKESAS